MKETERKEGGKRRKTGGEGGREEEEGRGLGIWASSRVVVWNA
jgi:hypothetical protein